MKKVLSAAIVKILEFDSPEEAREYLDGMKAAGKNFRVMWECDVAGNKRQIAVQQKSHDSGLTRKEKG